jgi:prepilin-type N-terminal cleavage/methylation domain-containing protein
MAIRGYSMLELLVAISIMAIATGAAISFVHGSVDESRAAGAASYVAGRMAIARFEAVKRSACVAIRFTKTPDGDRLRAYVDGNGNGVLSQDIKANIDHPVTGDELLEYHFPGITFGILPNVTSIDPPEPLNMNDPIQIGASNLLSFSPEGSSTSGTVFIRGRRSQFAVRVLGATGRTRTLQFNFAEGAWRSR